MDYQCQVSDPWGKAGLGGPHPNSSEVIQALPEALLKMGSPVTPGTIPELGHSKTTYEGPQPHWQLRAKAGLLSLPSLLWPGSTKRGKMFLCLHPWGPGLALLLHSVPLPPWDPL
jgi:hypothetical protein